MTRSFAFRTISTVLALFGALLFSGAAMFAQISSTGAISGVVSDSSGAVIPGASITATNLATGLVRQTASSAAGDYSIQLLPPGAYSLEVSKTGFAQRTFLMSWST